MMSDYSKKFIVKPGSKVRLKHFDAGYHGKRESHERALPETQQHIEKMAQLQYLMYAERKDSLLVVHQGLHAAGEDGTTQTWRLYLATEGAGALLFFVLRLSARESPHWLMSRGKFAKAALAFIRIIPEELQAVLQVTGTLVWVANERCSANQPKMHRQTVHRQL